MITRLDEEPNRADLMKPFPSERMTMWPIKNKVVSVKNNTPDIIDPIDE